MPAIHVHHDGREVWADLLPERGRLLIADTDLWEIAYLKKGTAGVPAIALRLEVSDHQPDTPRRTVLAETTAAAFSMAATAIQASIRRDEDPYPLELDIVLAIRAGLASFQEAADRGHPITTNRQAALLARAVHTAIGHRIIDVQEPAE